MLSFSVSYWNSLKRRKASTFPWKHQQLLTAHQALQKDTDIERWWQSECCILQQWKLSRDLLPIISIHKLETVHGKIQGALERIKPDFRKSISISSTLLASTSKQEASVRRTVCPVSGDTGAVLRKEAAARTSKGLAFRLSSRGWEETISWTISTDLWMVSPRCVSVISGLKSLGRRQFLRDPYSQLVSLICLSWPQTCSTVQKQTCIIAVFSRCTPGPEATAECLLPTLRKKSAPNRQIMEYTVDLSILFINVHLL